MSLTSPNSPLRFTSQLKALVWGLAIATSACLSPIATREAIEQVEQVFDEHQMALTELATAAVSELEQSGESDLRLPEAEFYDSAWVSKSLNSEALVVDFVIDEFYLPLVYISTDNPDDAHDTCANGGRPIKQLEANWYICQRDWN